MEGSVSARIGLRFVGLLMLFVGLLLAVVLGPLAPAARAETVLSQNWEGGLASQTPSSSSIDPLTGKQNQWLIFSGGYPGIGGNGGASGQEPGQGTPDTSAEALGADGRPGWPAGANPFYLPGSEEPAADNPARDAHNFWHVQESPQAVSINPFITSNLISLPPGESSALPAPPSGSKVAWFGSESSGTYCATMAQIEANPSNTAGSENGCETPAEEAEQPEGGAGAGNTVQEGELVSPPFSLAVASSAVMHFESWFEVEAVAANLFDIMEVDYTTNAGTKEDPFKWHLAGTLNPANYTNGAANQGYTDEGLNTPGSWQSMLVDLTPAIGSPHVRVRFVFDTWDVLYNGFRGWLLGNVSVVTPSDAPAPQITSVAACSGTSVSPVTVIGGSGFFLGSKVRLDGEEEQAQTPSSSRIEIPAPPEGVHTVQIVDPNGTTVSNVYTFDEPSSCEPSPPPPSSTSSPAPSPTPSPTPPFASPPAEAAATSENGLGSPAPTCADHSVTLVGGITVQASCFHVTKGGQLVTTGHIRVNGLDVVISGSGGFTLDTKKLKLYASGQVNVYAGSLHIYHGKLSWDFKKKLDLGVPKGLKIKGLPVSWDITV
ncbi:MAG: hypothetical protein ACYCXW_09765, partial [Solirubrobacteraceae bacterium]